MLSTALTLAAPGAGRAQDLGPGAKSADEQAARLEGQLTLDERLGLTHGVMALPLLPGFVMPPAAIPGAGFVAGVPRLNIPPLWETDASLGVAWIGGRRGDGATALPSGLATASTWNPGQARAGGAMIAREARSKGFNVLLAGGVDLARDPRNGRNFEYMGEDPLLAGVLTGEAIEGIQSEHVISTVKHFAFNDLETGRDFHNAVIGEAAARESDLLAFEIAIERGRPGAVMCAYNRVNGPWACESRALLTSTLKQDWSYPGWVMSDWGAVHGLQSALAGLDQQSGSQLDDKVWFDAPLRAAVANDPADASRLSDMDRRILRSMIQVGVIDHPPVKGAIDAVADEAVARGVAERGIVLLLNRNGLLPLARSVGRIAVIGGHADLGVISGGGSSQVAPAGGPALSLPMGGEGLAATFDLAMYQPSSPLKAIRALAPAAKVTYDNGIYPSAAAELARRSDVAIVFATQWQGEGMDVPDLSLPEGQDALIAAVAAANPNTIVVLETGGPVAMPWLDQVGAAVEAWYPGARGGEAIAGVLFGDVNPSGRLPITFPADVDQLPRPAISAAGLRDDASIGPRRETPPAYDVDYTIEGSDVGYRWFARKGLKPLFPFGYGLSYSRFSYGDLKVGGGKTVTVSFTVKNVGSRPGADTAQVYLTSGAGDGQQRLLGWSKLDLRPGEEKTATVVADPRLLADWDSAAHGWRIAGGVYQIFVGASAADRALVGSALVAPGQLRP